MKKIKFGKERLALAGVVLLSAILNLYNLGIEGYGNLYYASGVKSMTMSLKNFFFVSFDPAGFVSIDKPPVGFWLQAISAKLLGFTGFSIILPQALAGVLSVYVLYRLVKRAFGTPAGLLSALFLAVTPVFVAASRNNTIDNVLVLVLLLACYALTAAAEKGKLKYLLLAVLLVGIGFNIKMLQAYMVGPALYITYLLSTSVSIKRRLLHLVLASLLLVGVSLSWAVVVDLVPASARPYVDSSTNNTVMELILGHNGAERLSLSSSSNSSARGGSPTQGSRISGTQNANSNENGSGMGAPPSADGNSSATTTVGYQDMNSNGYGPGMGTPPSANGNSGASTTNGSSNGNGPGGNPSGNGYQSNSGNSKGFSGPGGGFHGGPGMRGGFGGNGNGSGSGSGSSGLNGSFGGETKSGFTRLFSKNMLSDQVVWFLPLAILGFILAAIRERLTFKLNNVRKQSLALWILWFLPVFIYFSFNTGLFHPYYLTMLAPPAAALAAIGLITMWEQYKRGGLLSWSLPVALVVNGGVQLLMLSYFYDSLKSVKILGGILIGANILPAVILAFFNVIELNKPYEESDNELKTEVVSRSQDKKRTLLIKIEKILAALSIAALVAAPLTGSGAAMFKAVSGTIPAAGLELLAGNGEQTGTSTLDRSNNGLVQYLQKNKTTEKYLLVVDSIQTAENIILKTGDAVMSLGGFMGTDNILTLDEFKTLVQKGEVRYVLVQGMGGGRGQGDGNAIMTWAAKYGKLISSSNYSTSTKQNAQQIGGRGGFGNENGQLYDLKNVFSSSSTK